MLFPMNFLELNIFYTIRRGWTPEVYTPNPMPGGGPCGLGEQFESKKSPNMTNFKAFDSSLPNQLSQKK